MRSSAPSSARHLGRIRIIGFGAASVVAATFGLGALGVGAAFAQGTHHGHAPTAGKLTAHERRESPAVRSSETSTNDPNSGDPNEPADTSSTDPSANDEGSTDTSSSDVNDSQDSTSVDSATLQRH